MNILHAFSDWKLTERAEPAADLAVERLMVERKIEVGHAHMPMRTS